MLFFSILSYLLLGVAVILTMIIFIPYHYHVSGEKLEESQIQGSISWLFGGIKIDFRRHAKQKMQMDLILFGLNKKVNIKQKSTQTEPQKEKELEAIKNLKKVKRTKPSHWREYLKPPIIRKALSVVFKILEHSQPKKLFLYVKVGFSDPMYTGLLYALKSQFYMFLDKYDIDIQPVFDEEIMEGRFLIGGRIWIPYLILVIIGFLISEPIRNIFISKFKRKIKGGPQYVR
ncbi:DUF2953 domain-containing protein [Desulfitobacterium sp. Sab5]|uniref:DUF2953 domain-containing protein n=1 Tax=Desulfitobacterium nosdiversum TaxID=3375356 RepID=UPI003CF8FD57